ncbi:tyrosine-type recombinase/integrase [Phaeobacter inhibens]|uniref:tyrosine-type recombinase/integrase n=1 Tax=Phaeobacter inhibens TaxID=221822 RepID=UPI0021A8ACEB|nr:site-specific integrase [Phaeobacter inhibens]UWR73137.1 site-specific integrase [Phaeobacter inhibens]UWR89174.1 site-specific integrase [Phaeobacter inhibens]
MASIRKLKSGYRAEVARNGVRKSKVFPTKQEAKDWAARAEFEILNQDKVAAKLTLGELFERYAREVSPSKRGHRWEVIRLEKIGRDEIAKIRLEDLSARDFAKWRDQRLKEVAPASVIREMQLMSSVLNVARKEWELISANPISDVRKPTKPQPRDRLPTSAEIEAMQISAGEDLNKATARAFHAFKFAMESAMRAGEIAGLEWDRVDLDRRVALLTHTKNGRPREVPLSTKAVELLRALPELNPVFGLSSRQLDVLFRKLRDRADVTGLTFHDSRHAAITTLSRKLDVLALARMVGHTDLRQLRVYYNESAEELAKRLD